MRMLIDMQSMQTSSRTRGIGHYSLSLVKEIVKKNTIEVILLVSDYSPEAIENICEAFEKTINFKNIKVFKAPKNVSKIYGKDSAIQAASLIRNYCIKAVAPDFLLITSLFEGASEDFICDIEQNRDYKVGVIGYDLIPLYNPELHLSTESMKRWYYEKIDELKKADIVFSISESSKKEFLEFTDLDRNKVINISSAGDNDYKPISENEWIDLRTRFSISKKFILYSGACDERKNLNALLLAYSKLDNQIRKQYEIVLVGKYTDVDILKLKKTAKKNGIPDESLIFTGFISNKELQNLYNQCFVFVFPSLHEGFGLPVLEAMMCGALTICSNVSSLPEVIGLEEATFNPYDVDSIKEKLLEVIESESLRSTLKKNALERATLFSWEKTANTLLKEVKYLCEEQGTDPIEYCQTDLIRKIFQNKSYQYSDNEVREIANCLTDNEIVFKILN